MRDHALLASASSNADLAALLCCATAARLSKPLLTTEPVAARGSGSNGAGRRPTLWLLQGFYARVVVTERSVWCIPPTTRDPSGPVLITRIGRLSWLLVL